MKAIKVSTFGAPDVLRFGEVEKPRPASGSVVIKSEAIGLGYMDTAARRGESYLAASPGFIPGYEVAGTISEIGPAVDEAWLGRRVFAILREGGGCAEFVALPAAELIALPDAISFETAVATGLNALVAQAGLARVPIAATDLVLVRGAAGGIGLMCVQYVALHGNAIVASTSSKERGEMLLSLGATSIWDRNAGDLGATSFDVIVDTIVGKDLPSYLDRLRANGRYLICGGVGGPPDSDFGTKIIEHFHSSPTLYAFSLNAASLDDVAREAAILFDHVQAGRILSVIDSVMPLSEAVAAHRRLDAGQAFGKVVLVPD